MTLSLRTAELGRHETIEHEPVRTSEEAARTRPGYTLHQGAKTMIVKAKGPETRFVMLVLPADLRFDNAKVKAALKAKDVRSASEREVVELTGSVLPGTAPPFANLFNLQAALGRLIIFTITRVIPCS